MTLDLSPFGIAGSLVHEFSYTINWNDADLTGDEGNAQTVTYAATVAGGAAAVIPAGAVILGTVESTSADWEKAAAAAIDIKLNLLIGTTDISGAGFDPTLGVQTSGFVGLPLEGAVTVTVTDNDGLVNLNTLTAGSSTLKFSYFLPRAHAQ
tara:strand:+ start:8799 stop:9254 length:456 start_codon:yes stop_codon:yes gene_type:complete